MKIILTLHAAKRCMKYCKLTDISEANEKLEAIFKRIYLYWKITNSHTGKKQVIHNGERIIYSESKNGWVYTIITYTHTKNV